jgi:8-oxo-dGTP pyrophosphatase MutT (NUDIX family)
VRKGEKILVSSEAWPREEDKFYLLPDGAIKYGEYAQHAIVREFKEELDSDIENVRYLGTLENIFQTVLGFGHELVLVYESDLVDKRLYQRGNIVGFEGDVDDSDLYGHGTLSLEFCWRSLEEMREEGRPLYPDGVEQLLQYM